MADDQFAPLMLRREVHDQRRHHAVELLAVAMRQEESPLLVQQELVEVRSDLGIAQAEFLRRGGPDRDPKALDPDGDGFACSWDPRPFQAARQ